MLVLIIGGSASGKSEFAENIAVNLATHKVYIATMQCFDTKRDARIQRHQTMRMSKGFVTKEIPYDIHLATLPFETDLILVECISTLLANEIYSNHTPHETVVSKIMDNLCVLYKSKKHSILVSNDVFCDTDAYEQQTLNYRKYLGSLHTQLAQKADVVIEVVAGIPIYHKGAFCI
ncbi:MAG: bifunctional adenosylcobinamide kinase/adenosylcobinamide-phosphate guanylyltransferase [Oscillospiraceae bacterium]